MLLISQFTETVLPTAAVACVPMEPTIAVSMYCTAVCIRCSSIVGQAREMTDGSNDQANMDFFSRIVFMVYRSKAFAKIRF